MAISLLAANNAQSVLAAGISAAATTLTVNTGTGGLFPSPVPGTSFFKLTLIDAATGTLTEIVHVTQRVGDQMTIERGQEGTAGRIWSANDLVANMMTAGTLSYLKQDIDGKLAKDQNGADIPDKNQFIKNLGLTETVDCAKNALDKRTGGTVNGDIISQGGQIGLKGDDRKHFILANSDGKVRADIWKDKDGDGVRLNNGNDGGGDYIFHKDGGFRAPSSLYAGAARIASDGNIYGSMWGNQWLDAYLKKTFQPKGEGQAYTKEESDARYVQKMQRGAPTSPPRINVYGPAEAPIGCVLTRAWHDSNDAYGLFFTYRPLQMYINGAWRTISDISDTE